MKFIKKIKTLIKQNKNFKKVSKQNTLSNNCQVLNILNVNGKENIINISETNYKSTLEKIKIYITGNNNKIEINDNLVINRKTGRLVIEIVGDNNLVKIGNNIAIETELYLQLCQDCKEGLVEINDNTTFSKARILTNDNKSKVIIGKECMFSTDVSIMNSDSHTIIQNGKLVNRGKTLTIGNHCWIGHSVVICKNVQIPDDTIVARNAVVVGGGALKG